MELFENLIVELTTLCNLKCIHCGYKLIKPHQEIDKDYLVDIVLRLKPLGIQTVMFTGGEPTLYSELIEIARFCKQEKLHVKIATNGSNLEPIITLLNEATLDELVISVDAVQPMTYKSIRGRNLLHQIFSFIQGYPQFSNRIHVSYLIQRNNYKELIPFLHQCQSLKIAGVSLLVPHLGGDFTSLIDYTNYRKQVFLSNGEIDEFRNVIGPQLREFYILHPQVFKCSPKHIDALIDYLSNPDTSHFFRSGICSFPLKTIFLYSNGEVSLCPYHPDWKNDFNVLLSDIKTYRMRCVFEGKDRNSYCRHCLEVPL